MHGQSARSHAQHPLEHASSESGDRSLFTSAVRQLETRPALRRKLQQSGIQTDTMNPHLRPRGNLRSRSYSDTTTSSYDWTSSPGASGSRLSRQDQPQFSSTADTPTREVLVHTVLPTDSLAGVALKYGIKIAALRKANKMWPSDSIHLRKELYIPVDYQLWSKRNTIPEDGPNPNDLTPDAFSLSSVSTSPTSSPTSHPDQLSDYFLNGTSSKAPGHRRSFTSSAVSFRGSSSGDAGPGPPPHPVSRRVPISEMSFFPPPSSSHSRSADHGPSSHTAPRYRIPPGSTSLPSLFSLFPSLSNETLNQTTPVPSTNSISTFLSRLSTDSLSGLSNLSNPLPRPPRTSIDKSVSDESSEDVEMDVVREGWRHELPHPRAKSRNRGDSRTDASVDMPNGHPSTSSTKKRVVRTQPEVGPQMVVPGTGMSSDRYGS